MNIETIILLAFAALWAFLARREKDRPVATVGIILSLSMLALALCASGV
jgi:hypothetical protein